MRADYSKRSGVITTCQVCEVPLCDENWTPSMQKYRRFICSSCWTERQKRYNRGDPNHHTKKRILRKKYIARLTPEEKERQRRLRYNAWLKRKYGISIDDYEKLLEDQNGKCEICKDEPCGRGSFHVDHCHNSGKVRALLCARCNLMLGLAKDSVQILTSALAYLHSHGTTK